MSAPATGLNLQPKTMLTGIIQAGPAPKGVQTGKPTARPDGIADGISDLQRPGVFRDVFVAQQQAEHASGQAAEENPSMIKHFFKGMASPFLAFAQHPVRMTTLVLGGMAMAHWLPMTLAPILVIGAVLSLFEGGKSLVQYLHYLKEGDKASAAKALESLGTATTTGILIGLGNKGGAAVTAEGKAALAATRQGKNAAEAAKLADEAAQTAQSGSFMSAIRENLSVFTSKDGFKALLHTFSPTSIRKNFHLPFISKHAATAEAHPTLKSSTGGAKGGTGFIASFIDDLVVLSFAKNDHEYPTKGKKAV